MDEQKMYDQLTAEHVKLLGQREKEKLAMHKEKINLEKESRDRQLNEERRKKRNEEKQNHKAEVDLVERLQNEMEAERNLQQQKRD